MYLWCLSVLFVCCALVLISEIHTLCGRYQWVSPECSRRPVVGTLGTLVVDHLVLPPYGAVMALLNSLRHAGSAGSHD